MGFCGSIAELNCCSIKGIYQMPHSTRHVYSKTTSFKYHNCHLLDLGLVVYVLSMRDTGIGIISRVRRWKRSPESNQNLDRLQLRGTGLNPQCNKHTQPSSSPSEALMPYYLPYASAYSPHHTFHSFGTGNDISASCINPPTLQGFKF